MNDLMAAKRVVRDFHDRLDASDGDGIAAVLGEHVPDFYRWRGFHPFHELAGAEAVADVFWKPLRRALTRLHRRTDIFMAGRNEIDGFESIWVCSMGHLMGLFDEPWLGIAPTGKLGFLRYGEFHRVEGGTITETALFCDIPHLMAQAGLQPFPGQTAAQLVQPGPATHDGLLYGAQKPEEGEKTLALINRMIADLGQWNSDLPIEQELAQTWHDDMVWWGPTGIGATYTIDRYIAQHAQPFRNGFSERSGTGHVARLAEGRYGGFFGWPNFTARPRGGFMGMPEAQEPAEFRVIDIYRRDGDRLAENWVFIDLLHYLNQQGIDILGNMASGLEKH